MRDKARDKVGACLAKKPFLASRCLSHALTRYLLGPSAFELVFNPFALGVGGFGSEASFDTLQLELVSAVSTVPVPAAAWLFGTGLLGLLGFARRKEVL